MFKSFKGGKSKAVKGLVRFNALLAGSADELLKQVDGEWGFDTDAAEKLLAGATADQTDDTVRESSESTDTSNTDETGEPESDEPEAPVASGNMFASIGATLGAVASTPAASATRAPAASRTAYTIEKDRPEQNGIKRPSAGGLCRAVWDAMDAQREANTGETPSTQQVRDLALMHNWNVNNAMIEYYQWRKFNGITGRAKKVEAAPATV